MVNIGIFGQSGKFQQKERSIFGIQSTLDLTTSKGPRKKSLNREFYKGVVISRGILKVLLMLGPKIFVVISRVDCIKISVRSNLQGNLTFYAKKVFFIGLATFKSKHFSVCIKLNQN